MTTVTDTSQIYHIYISNLLFYKASTKFLNSYGNWKIEKFCMRWKEISVALQVPPKLPLLRCYLPWENQYVLSRAKTVDSTMVTQLFIGNVQNARRKKKKKPNQHKFSLPLCIIQFLVSST